MTRPRRLRLWYNASKATCKLHATDVLVFDRPDEEDGVSALSMLSAETRARLEAEVQEQEQEVSA